MATLSSESKRDLLLLNLRRSISDAQKIIHAADATKQLLALFRDHLNDPAHKAQPRSNIFKYSNTTSRTHESNPVLAVGDPSSETFDMTQNTSGSKHDLLLFNLRTSISALERIQFDVNTTKDHFRDVLNDPSHKPRPQFNIFKQTGAIPYTGEPRNGLSDSDPCLKYCDGTAMRIEIMPAEEQKVRTENEVCSEHAAAVSAPANGIAPSEIDAGLGALLAERKIHDGARLCRLLGVQSVGDLAFVQAVDLDGLGWLPPVSRRKFLRLVEETSSEIAVDNQEKTRGGAGSSSDFTSEGRARVGGPLHSTAGPESGSSAGAAKEGLRVGVHPRVAGRLVTARQSGRFELLSRFGGDASRFEDTTRDGALPSSACQMLIFDSSRCKSRCAYDARRTRLKRLLKDSEAASAEGIAADLPGRGDRVQHVCTGDDQALSQHVRACSCLGRSVLTPAADPDLSARCIPSGCVWRGCFVKAVDSKLCVLRWQPEREASESLPDALGLDPPAWNAPVYLNYLKRYSGLTRPSLALFQCRLCSKHFPRSKLRISRKRAERGKLVCIPCSEDGKPMNAAQAVGAVSSAEASADSGGEQSKGWSAEVPVNQNERKHAEALSRLRKRVADNKQITVFLSSPFQGLLHERDGLVGSKGPHLVNMCESRGVSFNFVDLRWGISNTMSKRNLTIKTCLQYIAESDVFVGFFGQRYGASMLDGKSASWIKPSLELCYDDFEWLKGLKPVSSEDETTTLKSVTHLEFEYGYNDRHQKNGIEDTDQAGPLLAYAFFRDKGYDSEQLRKFEHVETEAWKFRPENRQSADMLENLKIDVLKWAKKGRGAYFTYKQPADFCNVSFRELKVLLESVLPQTKNTLETVHESYAKALARNFVTLESSLSEQKLILYANGKENKILVVTGGPGSGKSSLLARFVADFGSKHASCCLYHFCGMNRASRQLDVLLGRMLREAARNLSLADDIVKRGLDLPMDEQIGWVIAQWTRKRDKENHKMLIVIDALNELINVPYDEGAYPHDLGWLFVSDSGTPQPLPPGVRVIVSTLKQGAEYSSGRAFQVLEARKCLEENIPRLNSDECKQMMLHQLTKARKTWEDDSNSSLALSSISETGNPLFITLFINELIFFGGYKVSLGVYEQLNLYIEKLKQATDVSRLLELMFQRIERTSAYLLLAEPLLVGNGLIVSKVDEKIDVFCLTYRRERLPSDSDNEVECGSIVRFLQDGKVKHLLVMRTLSSLSCEAMDINVELEPVDAGPYQSDCLYLIGIGIVSRMLRVLWASREGLNTNELLAVLNMQLQMEKLALQDTRTTDGENGHGQNAAINQEDISLALSSMKAVRLLVQNEGLISFSHHFVRKTIESRYLAYSQAGIQEIDSFSERKRAERALAGIHGVLADYFRTKVETTYLLDDGLDQLPRPNREKNFHELMSGKKPSFLVAGRVRPFVTREIYVGMADVFVKIDKKHMCVKDPINGQQRAYTLDCCVSPNESQSQLWRRISGSDLVNNVLEGFNVSMIAYGQTGSGKTYTMFGPSKKGRQQRNSTEGLVQRAISQIFQGLELKRHNEPGMQFEVQIAAVEIYNENLRDIGISADQPESNIRALANGAIQGLAFSAVSSSREALSEVDEICYKRRVSKTGMNDSSSRSHCVIILNIEQTVRNATLKSRMNLVDLAGNERGRTRDQRTSLWADPALAALETEAISINKSLLALNRVIASLARGRTHVPYKESALTRILSDSLGGNALTVLVVTLSPSPLDFSETIGSLNYARAAKRIQNSWAKNEEEMQLEHELARQQAGQGWGWVEALQLVLAKSDPPVPWVPCAPPRACFHTHSPGLCGRCARFHT